ncbi:MAG: glucose 1-dehydrogenase [Rhodospirillaceae bacterium]|jgi:NAD(P)-dependent dehydrogenase (short-subunit alcohol dehydrogenase family)|nr:glucose 1-dehydrogenase [Rhodospirillaceae bacterium]MBT4589565.1 glucose 1-dehydrogenase [Rhodospirillaceae bacterium]MBT4939008.1 glucose 1-dehydrogenase [Rhodospirillaceae bacterium]MBT5941032.1 glucose 1-dehydrogenase [Rhodospirillaceae bacterium]MBT7265566.1 glucose 1-dehydrogenase [Rhodospirillaceae bacterium]
MPKLENKVAIVTGAAQGIGATYAKALAAEGAKVVLTDMLDCAPVAAEIEATYQGSETLALTTDVSDEQATQDMVDQTVEKFGRLDVLVNNAALFGAIKPGPFEEIDVAEWDKLMAVNVKGPWLCTKAASPVMRKQGAGKIINIASGTVFKGAPNLLHYVSSKGAIIAMTRSLSRELGEDGICVNTIAPGLTMSEQVLDSDAHMGYRDANAATRAIKRYQTPDDLIGALIFLSSADSDFMTGQCMVVDGGSANN